MIRYTLVPAIVTQVLIAGYPLDLMFIGNLSLECVALAYATYFL